MTSLLIIAFCIVVFAAAAQATTGFGFALVGVPLLTLAADPRTAVVAIITVNLLLVVMIAIRERAYIEWRIASVVTAAASVGIPMGLYILARFSEQLLTVIIALVVLAFTVLLAVGWHVPRGTPTNLIAGATSGVLLGATGMNGPPLVAAFQAMRLSPKAFRATLQAVFCAQGVIVVTGYAATGQFTEKSVTVALVAIPALFVGWWIGEKVFHRIAAGPKFRWIVLAAMAMSALLALLTAFG